MWRIHDFARQRVQVVNFSEVKPLGLLVAPFEVYGSFKNCLILSVHQSSVL